MHRLLLSKNNKFVCHFKSCQSSFEAFLSTTSTASFNMGKLQLNNSVDSQKGSIDIIKRKIANQRNKEPEMEQISVDGESPVVVTSNNKRVTFQMWRRTMVCLFMCLFTVIKF